VENNNNSKVNNVAYPSVSLQKQDTTTTLNRYKSVEISNDGFEQETTLFSNEAS